MLKKGSKGPAVESLQAFMTQKGLYVGKLDGEFGPKTEYAVRVFQASNALERDGVMGGATYELALKAGWRPAEDTTPVPQAAPTPAPQPAAKPEAPKV